MAHKITLTVPDNLYREINRWRAAFNLSRIFQEAVSEAIRRKNEFEARFHREQTLTETIRRLRRERSDARARIGEEACHEGERWAASAHYEDLAAVAQAPPGESTLVPATRAAIADAKPRISGDPAMSDSDRIKLITKGWHKGVCDFWDNVKDKLEE